jgi:hypothetical protein
MGWCERRQPEYRQSPNLRPTRSATASDKANTVSPTLGRALSIAVSPRLADGFLLGR